MTDQEDLIDAISGSLQPLLTGVQHLLLAIAKQPGRVSDPVMEAADEIRRAVAGLGMRDIGPPP